jgi:hypothetical protein
VRAGLGILTVVPEEGKVVTIYARCRGKIFFRIGWARGFIVGRGEIFLIGGFRPCPTPDLRCLPVVEWSADEKISFGSHDIEIVPMPDWLDGGAIVL